MYNLAIKYMNEPGIERHCLVFLYCIII